MGKSRKTKSRRKTRHHRLLQEQQHRQDVRGSKRYVPEKFNLKNHRIEIAFLAFLLLGVLGIILLGPDKKAALDMRASLSAVIDEKTGYLDEAYPYGYKIISLMGKDIVSTSYDTLPEDLEINWRDMSVMRIQTKQANGITEKIEVELVSINYPPASISGLSIKASFLRQEGASTVLTKIGDMEFVAEVIKDSEEQVFYLFGLR